MFRSIRTSNKICFDKDLKRSWRIHAEKVKSVKSTLSQKKPQQYPFLEQRPKKYALQEVRNMEIEKENSCLLDRIKNISQKGARMGYTAPKQCDSKSAQKIKTKQTLNEPFRKRELVKIVEENQELMKRIQSKKSMYNVKQWEKERKKVEKNITILSEFKYKDYPETQTKVNLWMTEEDFTKKSRVENYSIRKSRADPILVLSCTKKIGENYYLVDTFAYKKVFNIEIQSLEDSVDRYRLQMPEKEVLYLLEHNYEDNLNKLVDDLQINREEGSCYLRGSDNK